MCNYMEPIVVDCKPPASCLWVRPASPNDATDIAQIYNQYVGSGPYTMEEEDWTYLTVKHQLDHFTHREAILVCEDSDGKPIGWGRVQRYSLRSGYRIACELSTYVSRDAVGRGVGDALVKELITLSERYGYRHAVAKVIASNQASLRFHFKHGFEMVGVQRQIGIIDGKPADVAILQRICAEVQL